MTTAAARVIALLGAECTGKTELAQALRHRVAADTGLRVAAVAEGLRVWCERAGRTPQRHEQQAIAHAQDLAIEAALLAHDVVVTDTTSLMVALYSQHYFNDNSLLPAALASHQRLVGVTLLAATDLPWQADGIQRDGAAVRDQVQARLRGTLMAHRMAFAQVSGQGPARLESAMDAAAPWLRERPAPKRGLFTRLRERNAQPDAQRWRCEHCDDPDCEQALLR
jgi:nicotinamide riboside kinase